MCISRFTDQCALRLSREVSFVVGGGQHKSLQLIKAQRINVKGVHSHKRDPCIITLSQQA